MYSDRKRVKFAVALSLAAATLLALLLGPPSPVGRYEDDGRVGAIGHVCWDFSHGSLDLVIEDESYRDFIGSFYRTNRTWVLATSPRNDNLPVTICELKPYWWGVKIDNEIFYWRCFKFWKHKTGPNHTVQRTGASRSAQETNRTSSAASIRRPLH